MVEFTLRTTWINTGIGLIGFGSVKINQFIGFNKEVSPLLHMGWHNPIHQRRLRGASCWHHCGHNIEHRATNNAYSFHKANLLLNCIRKRVASRLKEVIIQVWRSCGRSSGGHYIRNLDQEGRDWSNWASMIWWQGLRILLTATYSYLKGITRLMKCQMQHQRAPATHWSKNFFTRSVGWHFDLEGARSLSLQVSKTFLSKPMADLRALDQEEG